MKPILARQRCMEILDTVLDTAPKGNVCRYQKIQ